MGNKHSVYESNKFDKNNQQQSQNNKERNDNNVVIPYSRLPRLATLLSLSSNSNTSIIFPSSLSSSALFSSLLFSRNNHNRTLCDAAAAPASPQPQPLPALPPIVEDKNAPPALPPPPPLSSPEADSIEAAAQGVATTLYSNPGPYEQAMMQCGKSIVSLDTYDGFRCDINKQLSPFMGVFHSFWVGTNMLPDSRKKMYTFMTQVADESGLLMTRIDFGRNAFDGRIHRALLGGLCMGKVQIGVGVEPSPNDQILTELDFGGHTWTGNVKYGSMGGGLVYGGNYFQAITPNLAIGGEGMYIAANGNLISSYMLRYQFNGHIDEIIDNDSTDTSIGKSRQQQMQGGTNMDRPGASTICLNYNAAQSMISCNYKRCVTTNNRVTLASELQFNPISLESNVLIGSEFKLQRSKLNFCIDGTGRIQSLVEAKLGMAHGSPSLNLSADVNYFTDELRFGYGINIEG